jgi:hypothetical protein
MIQSRENPTHRVIALSGWKGSGKDTVADYLQNEYGYTKLSFAASLKDIVAQMYGIERAWLDDPTRKEAPLYQYPAVITDEFTAEMHRLLKSELVAGYWTPRALCILEGSIKRSVAPNFWILKIIHQIISNPHTHYVVSDMRYRSEANTFEVLLPETKIMRVHRHGDVNTKDPSERDLDNYEQFSHRILNTGTVEELYRQVDRIITTE